MHCKGSRQIRHHSSTCDTRAMSHTRCSRGCNCSSSRTGTGGRSSSSCLAYRNNIVCTSLRERQARRKAAINSL